MIIEFNIAYPAYKVENVRYSNETTFTQEFAFKQPPWSIGTNEFIGVSDDKINFIDKLEVGQKINLKLSGDTIVSPTDLGRSAYLLKAYPQQLAFNNRWDANYTLDELKEKYSNLININYDDIINLDFNPNINTFEFWDDNISSSGDKFVFYFHDISLASFPLIRTIKRLVKSPEGGDYYVDILIIDPGLIAPIRFSAINDIAPIRFSAINDIAPIRFSAINDYEVCKVNCAVVEVKHDRPDPTFDITIEPTRYGTFLITINNINHHDIIYINDWIEYFTDAFAPDNIQIEMYKHSIHAIPHVASDVTLQEFKDYHHKIEDYNLLHKHSIFSYYSNFEDRFIVINPIQYEDVLQRAFDKFDDFKNKGRYLYTNCDTRMIKTNYNSPDDKFYHYERNTYFILEDLIAGDTTPSSITITA